MHFISTLQLKQRIDARQGKQKNEAAQLLSLGERQKTVLERTRQVRLIVLESCCCSFKDKLIIYSRIIRP